MRTSRRAGARCQEEWELWPERPLSVREVSGNAAVVDQLYGVLEVMLTNLLVVVFYILHASNERDCDRFSSMTGMNT